MDLRAETKGVGEQGRTDLAQKFSGHRVIKVERGQGPRKSRWDVSEVIQGGAKRNAYRYLYVLVDNGDGQAEKVVRRLHAAGVKRVAILTGGEQALRRQGQAEQVITQTGKRQPKN